MNIATVGIGGVGGYFGGMLSRLLPIDDTVRLYFIARNDHLREIRKNGLTLETDEGTFQCVPTVATDNPDDLPILDIVLLCVKGFDLEDALRSIERKIVDQTIILPLLNGIDIYDRVKKVVPESTVLPACAYIGTHIKKPGTVKQSGGACTLILGSDPKKDANIDGLTALFAKAKVKYSFTDQPEKEIWSKFLFIASFGLVCADGDKTIGEVLADTGHKAMVEGIMKEIHSLSVAMGIGLPARILDESIAKGRQFSYETKTSFQRDYETLGKKDERDVFGKAILDLGKKMGIKTPLTERVFDSLNAKKTLG